MKHSLLFWLFLFSPAICSTSASDLDTPVRALNAITSASTSNKATQVTAFIKTLNKPVSIRTVRFSRDKGFYEPVHLFAPPSSLTNYSLSVYEGGVQSHGFYLRHLTNSPFFDRASRLGEEVIFGENQMQFWQLDTGHHILGISPKHSNTNPFASREYLCTLNKRLIIEVQSLGLQRLKGFNLELKDDYRFHGSNILGENITGQVSLPSNQVHIAFRSSTSPDILHNVLLSEGNSNTNYLVAVTSWAEAGGKQGQQVALKIEAIHYGEDATAASGYRPLLLRHKRQPLASLLLYTNNNRFIVRTDGSLINIERYGAPTDQPVAAKGPGPFLLALIISSFCFSMTAVSGQLKK